MKEHGVNVHERNVEYIKAKYSEPKNADLYVLLLHDCVRVFNKLFKLYPYLYTAIKYD